MALGAAPAEASSTRSMGLYPVATPAAPLPMVDSRIEVTVRGPLVETVVTQRFVNRSDRATEATYIFPLPYDAAVSAMSIKQGTRTIRAAIEPREAAQQRYEAAVRAGVAAAVLDQERPDVFTQTVAAVPPKGTVEITLRYDTLARYADGTWSLVLPMVVAPRYVPGTVNGRPTTGSGRAPDTDRVPDASRVTPPPSPGGGGATTVAIEFAEAVREVTSPTHELSVAGARATFTDARTDHDAVIRWRSTTGATGWAEQSADGGYAAVVVEAPAAPARTKPVRLVLVLDRAATMRGDASAVGLPVVRALAGAMTSADRLAVTGSDRVAWSAPADALRAIEGAANNAGPFDLTRVLQGAKPDGAPMLLISDGLVADDKAVLAAARKLGVPIHVIAVGAAPARGLLVQLAAVTGGTIRFALPSDDLGAIARSTLADTASPPAPLAVNWGTLAASDVVPAVLPRLGAGQAMLVLARVKQARAANARARGDLFAIETLAAPRALDGAVSAMGPLARRWGRTKLDDLLVGNEDARAVTKHALAFGLVSPYTSLVAIGSDVVVEGGVKRSVAVPVAVPAGMHWGAVREETSPAGGELLSKLETPPPPPPAPKTTTTMNKGKASGAPASRPVAAKPAAPAPVQPTPPRERDDNANDPGGRTPARTSPIAAGPAPEAAPPADAKPSRRSDVADDVADKESPITQSIEDLREAPANEPIATNVAAADFDADGVADEQDGEAMVVRGEGRQRRRGYQLSLSLGGGLAIEDGRTSSAAALTGRIALGRRANLLGLQAGLWLVDGSEAQGRFLLDYTRRGIARWLELSLGAGLAIGDDTGAAGALVLRGHLPAQPALSGYLRYDAALLAEPQHMLTLGVEWGF